MNKVLYKKDKIIEIMRFDSLNILLEYLNILRLKMEYICKSNKIKTYINEYIILRNTKPKYIKNKIFINLVVHIQYINDKKFANKRIIKNIL